MAPKKKKTQLKSVNRGFATTSIPKKQAPEPEPAAVADEAQIDQGTGTDDPGVNGRELNGRKDKLGGKDVVEAGAGAGDEFDPEHVEEQALRTLAGKIRQFCDKEISKLSKVGENSGGGAEETLIS